VHWQGVYHGQCRAAADHRLGDGRPRGAAYLRRRDCVCSINHINGNFHITGWLSILMLLVLAQVFLEGTRMREDLEGTV
jgi:hypothetical protein